VIRKISSSNSQEEYHVMENDQGITYRRFLELLGTDRTFMEIFRKTLAKSKFNAFKYETPPISKLLIDNLFEFILVNYPGIYGVQANTNSFRDRWNS